MGRMIALSAGGALLLAGAVQSAGADTLVENSAEFRFQLDFHVNDAALQKLLPAGWETVIATQGPAKDANLRLIFIGLVSDAKEAPGPFGNYVHASSVKASRTFNTANGVTRGEENWEFIGANGERLETHVKYERGAARRNPTAEVKFFNPSNPSAYQIFKVDSGLDIMKNASVPVKDRVKEFTYKATGGNIGALFDGTEKVLSWDSFHWYNRGIFTP